MATRIIRKLARLLDVDLSGVSDGDALTYRASDGKIVPGAGGGGGGGAPTDADYLVGTANGALTNEIPVGTSPGGELGGSWAAPTVDTVHSGSSHAAVQAAAEATAAAALASHEADTTNVHGVADTSALYRAGGTDVAVVDGGTGASTASGARSNLGLGTAAVANTGDFDAAGAAAAAQAASQPLDSDLTAIAGLDSSTAGAIASDGSGWIKKTYAQFKTALSLVKGDVGLGNVDNTSDANKPVSTAQQTALDAKVSKSLYDANTVLAADTDDTPAALTMGASTILARLAAGNIKAASPSELRTLLSLVVGSDVQAYDAELAALAGLTSAANKLPYFTGSGAASLADFTAAGRALVDDADAAAQLTTLGISAFIQTLLDDANAGAARTTLGLGSLATLSAVGSSEITDGAIVNADVNASAAIAYSKLNLATSIVQGDLASALITALSGFSTAWTVVSKGSDTSRNSTTTPSADSELAFTATSGGLYQYLCYAIYVSASGAGTPDIKFGFGEDNTARGVQLSVVMSTADAAQGTANLGQQNSGHTAGTAATNRVLLTNGWHVGAGGTFALAWAQNTSSGSPNDTTVKAGSFLAYRRIL